MELDYIIMPMAINMQESGSMISFKGKVFMLLLMAKDMKVNYSMGQKKDMEHIII